MTWVAHIRAASAALSARAAVRPPMVMSPLKTASPYDTARRTSNGLARSVTTTGKPARCRR